MDVSQVPIPVGDVCDNHQVDQNGEEFVSCHHFIHHLGGQGSDGLAEAVELLKGRGKLVELG